MRKRRSWEASEEDPTSGLVNLFDIWMVFAVALLLSLLGAGVLQSEMTREKPLPTADAPEAVPGRRLTIENIQISRRNLSSEGERLGMAYRLKSGEIVYVPERSGRE
jgi:hypothetical protein